MKKATIHFQGIDISCEVGSNLRRELLKNGCTPYNNSAKFINCKGLGTCGTCAVEVHGNVSQITWIEQTRLNMPPLKGNYYLRLACQTKVMGDISVKKNQGFWGQKEETKI